MRTIQTSTTKTSTTRAYNAMLTQAVKSTAKRGRNSTATKAQKADDKIAAQVLSSLPNDAPIIDQGNLAIAVEPDYPPLNPRLEDKSEPTTNDLLKLAAMNQADFYRVDDIKSLVSATFTMNLELFGGKLADHIHIQMEQNRDYSMCFVADVMDKGDGTLKENVLKVNTDWLRNSSAVDVLTELAHNLVHAFQRTVFVPIVKDGKASKFNNRNHNDDFISRAKEIGLEVIRSEKSTYVVSIQRVTPGSPLDKCIQTLLADGFKLNWSSEAPEKKVAARATRIKYVCDCEDPIVMYGPKEMKHVCKCEDCGAALHPEMASK